ncbi:MAG: S8 family peptidase [Candidatus Methanofastidiosia archaeon]|jgi:subtilisin family serine protease
MRKISVGIIVVCLLFSVYSLSAPGTERVIVVFHDAPDVQLLSQYGQVDQVFQYLPAAVVTISTGAKQELVSNVKVKFVQPDYYRQYMEPASTTDVAPTSQVIPWGVDRIDADKAWRYSTGKEVRVGIIDTGIDRDHPDLRRNIKGGINTIAPSPQYPDPEDFDDDHGHGTHCAGIIGAVNNSIGVVGVAPDCFLYGIKAFDSSGSAYTSDCIEGIEWCIEHEMQVISMSWGSYDSDDALEEMCKIAWDRGIILVAAAGNEGYYLPDLYPAGYETVMAISATDINDNIAPWSNYGEEIELAAPGVNILSTYMGGGYALMSGTSMACPHVSGTAALVFAMHPEWNNLRVRKVLQKTAEDLGPPGWDPYYGFGLVDAERAVLA